MDEKKNEIILFENQGVQLEVNIKDDAKIKVNLTKDGLLDRYYIKTEYGNGLCMSFSYDYVQDHFENINEIEPLEKYKNIIIFE